MDEETIDKLISALYRHDCPDEMLLVQYADAGTRDAMEATERQAVQEHTRQCSICSAHLAEYSAVGFEAGTHAEAESLGARIRGVAQLIASTLEGGPGPQPAMAVRGAREARQVFALAHGDEEVLIVIEQPRRGHTFLDRIDVAVALAGITVEATLSRQADMLVKARADLPALLRFTELSAGEYELHITSLDDDSLSIEMNGIIVLPTSA